MTHTADTWGRPVAGSGEIAQWYYLGRGALTHRDWRMARSAFERAAPQLRDSAEWPLLWLCQIALATTAWREHDAPAALAHAREAHVLSDRLDGIWTRAWSLWLLGHLYAALHQLAEAASCFMTLADLLDEQEEDRRTIRALALVAAMLCADSDADPAVQAERLFGLARLAVFVGLRRGLPLESLVDLDRAPRLLGDGELAREAGGRGPLEWLRNILPHPEARQPAGPTPAPAAPAEPRADAGPGDEQAPDVRAYCLGRFEVWVGQTLVADWAGLKCRTLLKLLLAAHPAAVPAPRLMDALWPGVEEELARQRLHTAISDLRRTLRAAAPERASLVVSQGGAYGLDPQAAVWIDVQEFDRAWRTAQQYAQVGRQDEAEETLRQAVALYRGEYLEEDVYEDWPTEQRERLKSAYLTLLTRLCQWAFAAQDYEGCLSWGRLTLECDPCREDAHRLLMRCYSRLGQRATALRQYRQCVDALRRGLDALPEPETEELHRRLQQGHENLAPSAEASGRSAHRGLRATAPGCVRSEASAVHVAARPCQALRLVDLHDRAGRRRAGRAVAQVHAGAEPVAAGRRRDAGQLDQRDLAGRGQAVCGAQHVLAATELARQRAGAVRHRLVRVAGNLQREAHHQRRAGRAQRRSICKRQVAQRRDERRGPPLRRRGWLWLSRGGRRGARRGRRRRAEPIGNPARQTLARIAGPRIALAVLHMRHLSAAAGALGVEQKADGERLVARRVGRPLHRRVGLARRRAQRLGAPAARRGARRLAGLHHVPPMRRGPGSMLPGPRVSAAQPTRRRGRTAPPAPPRRPPSGLAC